jgi:hypothetical protein
MIRISDDIYNYQKNQFEDNMFVKSLNLYRKQSDWLKEFTYSNQNDTIFILELPGIQGDYYFTFWNKIDTLSYSNETGIFKFEDKPKFTKFMMKLVSEWNISEIKKEEDTNSNLLPSESIYATKIIIGKGKYKIDCIRFKEFFNLRRDEIDHY